jgi:5'-3' exonuclease
MKALLVDGNNILMRSIMAMTYSGLSANDTPTGPLLSFINTLTKHVREEQPSHMVVCWDAKGHRWRTDVDEDYKANRGIPPEEEFKRGSFALAKEFLALANIASVEVPEAEADDLIAAYWQGAARTDRITILSNDKDFLMLLADGHTEQVRVSSGGAPTDRWTAQRVLDDLGCTPTRLPLVMALTGDTSDNVIGIHGIGPKKAVKALTAANWDLSQITDVRIIAEIQRVYLNLDLVDLRKPRDWISVGEIPEFRPTTVASALHPLLVDFLLSYQMQGTLGRYNERNLWGWRD